MKWPKLDFHFLKKIITDKVTNQTIISNPLKHRHQPQIKRVCLISPFPPPYGGMAVQAEKLSQLLAKEGFQVVTVPTNQGHSARCRKLYRLPVLRTLLNLIFFSKHLHHALKTTDIVYFLTGFYNYFFHVTLPAFLIIKMHGKPLILSARGGNASKFFKQYKHLVGPVLKHMDVITTPSGFLQTAFRQQLGIDTVIIPNIADLDQFEFLSRKCFAPRLLVTRNLELIYDVAQVIKAFEIITQKYPNATLSIAGDGSQRKDLENQVLKAGLNENVTFYGQVDHDKIQQLYKTHDIYVNASRVDNLPGVILEAFACGLPVVSTDAGGIPYMIAHGKTGLLSPAGCHENLAANVIKIVENPEFGCAITQAARSEIPKYSWTHIRPLMKNILEKV